MILIFQEWWNAVKDKCSVEAAAHMNKLQHNLLQTMSELELSGDDFGYLEGDLRHVWEPLAR